MSQRDKALEAIRKVVLAGRIPAGQRTSERRLTDEFLAGSGLGRTPVREALAILTEQGIVEQYPQAGFAVRVVHVKEARSALRLQHVTESLAVAEAAKTGAETTDLAQLANRIEDEAECESCANVLNLEREFHMRVTALGGYGSGVDAIGGFRDRIALFLARTRELEAREQMEIAAGCRQLAATMREDVDGDRSRAQLERLLRTEDRFIIARAETSQLATALA